MIYLALIKRKSACFTILQVNLIASITAVMIEVTEHSDVNCRSKKSRTKSKVETAQSPAAAKTDNTASISCAAFLTGE